MDTQTIILIVVFIIVLDVVLIGAFLTKYKDKRAVYMQLLADKFGLDVIGGEPFLPGVPLLNVIKKPVLALGKYRSRELKVYHFTRGSGKNSTTYASAKMQGPNPKNLSFQFYREGLFSKLGKAMGMQDVQLGDPQLDKLIVVKCSDPWYIQAALLPEVRQKLVTLWEVHKAKGKIELEGDSLHYDEVGAIRNDDVRKRFEVAVEVLGDLSEAIHVYNEQASG